MSRCRTSLARSLVALLVCLAASAAFAQDSPPTYVGEYSAAYKGREVGMSVFSVQASTDSARLTYSSETRIKGFLRLVSPNPVIDRSEFEVDAGRIVPRRFEFQDGSRKGEDNYTIEFDRAAHKAIIDGEDGRKEIDITPGTLDRGSVQVAMMLNLNRGIALDTYDVVDDDSVETYHYRSDGERTVDTGLGPIEVVTYTQTREGSSRYTTIDFAPSLDYIPVRLEQFRNGESQSAFVLQSIER